jgi:hypothetical protein
MLCNLVMVMQGEMIKLVISNQTLLLEVLVAYLVILESSMVKFKWLDYFGIPLTFSVLVKSLSRSLLKSLWVGFITFTNSLFFFFSIYTFRVGLNYNTDLKIYKNSVKIIVASHWCIYFFALTFRASPYISAVFSSAFPLERLLSRKLTLRSLGNDFL